MSFDRRRFSDNRPPDSQPLEKITGIHTVLESLQADEKKIEQIYCAQGMRTGKVKEIEERAIIAGIPVDTIAASQIAKLCGHSHHQGVIAMVRPHRLIDLQTMLQRSTERSEPPFYLIIDQVQDPRNLGAILRNAEGSGVDGVIMTTKRTSPLSPVAIQTSSGAAAHLDMCRVVNLVQAIEQLKTLGVWIIGTDPQATQTIYDIDGRDAVAIVVGNEGQGMRRLVRETCDWLVSIPMCGQVESLNVSVSSALILYEVRRQRNFASPRPARPPSARFRPSSSFFASPDSSDRQDSSDDEE